MLSLRLIFLLLIGSNFLTLSILSYNFFSFRENKLKTIQTRTSVFPSLTTLGADKLMNETVPRFSDVDLAFKILSKLNVSNLIIDSDDEQKDIEGSNKQNVIQYQDFMKDNSFCVKNTNISILNMTSESLMMQKNSSFCFSQPSNYIPGSSIFTREDVFAEAMLNYSNKFLKRPQCFTYNKSFHRSWLLRDKKECLNFFKKVNNPQDQTLGLPKEAVYILRNLNDSKKTKFLSEEDLKEIYQNETLCSTLNHSHLVQRSLSNPLLLEKHKFKATVYMLIASANPLIAYYHDGFLKISFSDQDTEKNSSIWTFEQLQNYLLETGKITDSDWLNSYLRPEFKIALIHLLRMAQGNLQVSSSVYGLFSVEFEMDNDLRVWFSRANVNLDFDGLTEETEKMVAKMLKDHYEIVSGLFKSRMKRVILYINRLIVSEKVKRSENEDVNILDLEQRQEEFAAIMKNFFEIEYVPSKENGFSKIFDMNYFGSQRYADFFGLDCLI